MSKAKDKPLTFEQAVAQLETLITQVESGELGLEQSLTAYEQGVRLIAQCRSVLNTAEQKIAELKLDAPASPPASPPGSGNSASPDVGRGAEDESFPDGDSVTDEPR